MQITDPIADMLTRIRNANNAKHDSGRSASNMKKSIAQILLDEGYIKNFQIINDGTQGVIRIAPQAQQPRQGEGHLRPSPRSSPACAFTPAPSELPHVLRGPGIAIVSTSRASDRQRQLARPMSVVKSWHSFGKEEIELCLELAELPSISPAGVEVKIDGHNISVKGPRRASCPWRLIPTSPVTQEGNVLHVTRPNDLKETAPAGLTLSLVHNMVGGVTEGFQKTLDVNGVGLLRGPEGQKLVMNLGFS